MLIAFGNEHLKTPCIWNCESNKHIAESLPIVQLLGQSQARIQDLYFPACGQLEKLRVAYQSIHRSPW